MSQFLPFSERQSGGSFDDVVGDESDFNKLRQPNYAVLAELMGSNKEIAVFRKFDTLNMLVLSSLQAELLDLQHKLEDQILRDEHSEKRTLRETSKYFRQMWQADSDSQQWELLLEIRKKLKEYSS